MPIFILHEFTLLDNKKITQDIGKIASLGLIQSKPGAKEASNIKRQFEWKSKLESIQTNLKSVDNQLRDAARLPFMRSHEIQYDGYNIVKAVEDEARKDMEGVPKSPSPEMKKRIGKALNVLLKPAEKPKASDSFNVKERNEWSHFEKLETQRREFLEATYRRFRCGPIPDVQVPNGSIFEYQNVDFPLESGEVIQQPVASIRLTLPDPQKAVESVERYRSDQNSFTVGLNTTSSAAEIQSPPKPPMRSSPPPAGVDRDAFVAQLVLRKSAGVPQTIEPGQEVSVCYYGVNFPGIVLKRNLGPGTFTVRFDDGTVNDFPLHAITTKI